MARRTFRQPRKAGRPHSAAPPLSPGPFVQIEYPDREGPEDPREPFMGHPTVPGPKDPNLPRHGLPSPGNGQPGVPIARLAPGRGPGIPGTTPTGPIQPGGGIIEDEDF